MKAECTKIIDRDILFLTISNQYLYKQQPVPTSNRSTQPVKTSL